MGEKNKTNRCWNCIYAVRNSRHTCLFSMGGLVAVSTGVSAVRLGCSGKQCGDNYWRHDLIFGAIATVLGLLTFIAMIVYTVVGKGFTKSQIIKKMRRCG